MKRYKVEDINIAYTKILKRYFEAARLSSDGKMVETFIYYSDRQNLEYLYFELYPTKKKGENDSWGDILTKDIDDGEYVEFIYDRITQKLRELKYIDFNINSIHNKVRDRLVITIQGYRFFLKNRAQTIEFPDFGSLIEEKKENIIIAKNNKIQTEQEKNNIEIIHISDLHFGSMENINIDNKSNIKNTKNMSPTAFEYFLKIYNEISDKNSFVIISGDITSKNEEDGYSLFLENIEKMKVDMNNVYVVPGNHDVNRSESNEKKQYSDFITFLSKFNTPFSSRNYILKKEKKMFVIGFPSTHLEEGDEIVYIGKQDIDELENIVKKIQEEVDDFQNYIKIAVIHNNIISHPGIELKKYGENIQNHFIFKQKLIEFGFQFILSGHKHRAMIEKHEIFIDGFYGKINIISSGSLCGNVSNNRNTFQKILINQYDDFKSDFTVEQYELNSIKFEKVHSKKIEI